MKSNSKLQRLLQALCYALIGIFIIPCFKLALAMTIQVQQNKPQTYFEQSEVKEIVKLLESSASWSDLREDKSLIQNQKIILECLAKISKYDLAIIRESVVFFVDKKKSENEYNTSNMSRLFLLNRYIFNVPESMPFDAPAFGGWVGVPFKNEMINRLWPLTVSKAGEITIVGEFGGYFGPDYKAVQEFDYFLDKFGARVIKQ